VAILLHSGDETRAYIISFSSFIMRNNFSRTSDVISVFLFFFFCICHILHLNKCKHTEKHDTPPVGQVPCCYLKCIWALVFACLPYILSNGLVTVQNRFVN
jgi:hypothetical protein